MLTVLQEAAHIEQTWPHDMYTAKCERLTGATDGNRVVVVT